MEKETTALSEVPTVDRRMESWSVLEAIRSETAMLLDGGVEPFFLGESVFKNDFWTELTIFLGLELAREVARNGGDCEGILMWLSRMDESAGVSAEHKDEYLFDIGVVALESSKFDFAIRSLRHFDSSDIRNRFLSRVLDAAPASSSMLPRLEPFVLDPEKPDASLEVFVKFAVKRSLLEDGDRLFRQVKMIFESLVKKEGNVSVRSDRFPEFSRTVLECMKVLRLPYREKYEEIAAYDPETISEDWDRWAVAENLMELAKSGERLGLDGMAAFSKAAEVARMKTSCSDIDYYDCSDSIRRFNVSIPRLAFDLGHPELARSLAREFVSGSDLEEMLDEMSNQGSGTEKIEGSPLLFDAMRRIETWSASKGIRMILESYGSAESSWRWKALSELKKWSRRRRGIRRWA